MHFKMSSAIRFNLDQCKNLPYGKDLTSPKSTSENTKEKTTYFVGMKSLTRVDLFDRNKIRSIDFIRYPNPFAK